VAATLTPSDPGRTLGVWEADDVGVGEIGSAMARLRHQHRAAAVQTSVLTLVVVGAPAAIEGAAATVRDLGDQHPSRTLLIGIDPDDDAEAGLDARASLELVVREGASVCYDEVRLRVRGRARYHLDSVVEPFTLPDVPVVVWLPDDLPSPGDPLLPTVDRVVVDSRAVAQERPDTLARVAALGRRLPVADLSWYRLATWRSMLAGVFEGPAHRAFAAGVDEVVVRGNHGPRTLLAGWLLRRLGLEPEQVEVGPAAHVSVHLSATAGGRRATFEVARRSDERCVEAIIAVEGAPPVVQRVQMRRRWPALALASALTTMGADRSYAEALDGSMALVGR